MGSPRLLLNHWCPHPTLLKNFLRVRFHTTCLDGPPPATFSMARSGGLRRDQSRDIMFAVAMRSNGYIPPLRTCWIEGRACPRRYLSVLPSHVRAHLFGSA